jgi:hypothetical protein
MVYLSRYRDEIRGFLAEKKSSIIGKGKILSRVYGCLTNKNGIWIGCLDLLVTSCKITRNHNELWRCR